MIKKIIIPPCETLLELLWEYNITLKQFAQVCDLDKEQTLDLFSNEKPITKEIAENIEDTFGIDASFWLNLQKNYDNDIKTLDK